MHNATNSVKLLIQSPQTFLDALVLLHQICNVDIKGSPPSQSASL